MRVNYIYRKKTRGGNSIEELFNSISESLKSVDKNEYEVPNSGASLNALINNINFVAKKKDLIHVTGDIHYVSIIPLKKIILTIHDVNSIVKGSFIKKLFFKIFWFWLPLLFVKKATVISHFSKRQVLEIAPWAKNKIKVIYNPVNQFFKTSIKQSLNETPIVLHLGTKKNKNLENTIKSLKGLKCKLIIVGTLTGNQHELLEENKILFENYENVIFEKIIELYEQCDIVSFVSFYEGFGMPIIEAQKVGRPVITSRCASIPEIAGNAALFVDPNNVSNMRNGFIKLFKEESLRANLVKLGLKNVERFDLKKISNDYLNLYKELFNEN